ncbi:Ig-like domain-containing protein, partial [Neptunicoccus cionae]|uniref:Ig-like domain-containing protein n=1 Tax=Neptunicoccus cionae TaxID=2035344 RepID=UPI000CAA9753
MPTPSTPVITGYSTDTGTVGDNITSDRSITFTGTGTPGASLEIVAFGAYTGTVAFLSAIPASGNWTVTVGDGGSYPVGSDGELQNGSYSFRAGSRIGADASSLSSALDITVDGPELSGIDLTSASDTGSSNTDNYTADSTPAIEFTAGNGDALEIDWGDGLGYQSVGTGTGGSQTFTNPNAYPGGITEEKTILVRSTKDGTSTVESLTFTYDRETISPNGNIDASSDTGSSQTDHITSDTTPTLSGTGEVGATIEIKLGDGLSPTVATAVVGSGGTWSTTLSALSDGSYPLTLRSVDKAGNVTQLSGAGFTIDTTDPAAPAISTTISHDTGISSSDRVTQDDTVRVSGTTEANTVVRIYDGAVLVGIDQTTSTGNWAITTSSLSDGVHTLRAEAEDLAGNKSILSSPLDVTIDTTAPAAPTLDLAAASDTGASDSDDV